MLAKPVTLNPMRIRSSLDWNKIGAELRSSMQNAPAVCRKDLARMLGSIEGLVQQLSGEEVILRRNKKLTSATAQRLLAEINESIMEYEKWLVFAHLSNG